MRPVRFGDVFNIIAINSHSSDTGLPSAAWGPFEQYLKKLNISNPVVTHDYLFTGREGKYVSKQFHRGRPIVEILGSSFIKDKLDKKELRIFYHVVDKSKQSYFFYNLNELVRTTFKASWNWQKRLSERCKGYFLHPETEAV